MKITKDSHFEFSPSLARTFTSLNLPILTDIRKGILKKLRLPGMSLSHHHLWVPRPSGHFLYAADCVIRPKKQQLIPAYFLPNPKEDVFTLSIKL